MPLPHEAAVHRLTPDQRSAIRQMLTIVLVYEYLTLMIENRGITAGTLEVRAQTDLHVNLRQHQEIAESLVAGGLATYSGDCGNWYHITEKGVQWVQQVQPDVPRMYALMSRHAKVA